MEEPILLVDEVLAVGDAAFRRKCAEVIERMIGEGRTFLLVSHNENDLRRWCKRGIYLKNGSMVTDGPVDDVLDEYAADAAEQN
jgi:ABC-2 type transport system ATP-binding protein